MSYCVNCGVELEATIKKCPLCETPVMNPNEMVKEKEHSPFPEKLGQVEGIKRKDIGILLSSVFVCVAVSCSLLNYFVFPGNRWSLLVVGFCGLMWTMTVPPVVVPKLRMRISTLVNCLMVCIYLLLIGFFADSFEWIWQLGLPITMTVCILIEIFLTVGKNKRTFLVLGSTFFAEVAILCVVIELLVQRYRGLPLHIHWSSIVLTVCVILDITLLTMLSRKRIRNEIQRRFHF